MVEGSAKALMEAVTAFESRAKALVAAVVDKKTAALAAHAKETNNVAKHSTAGIAFANAVMDMCNPSEQLMLMPLLTKGLDAISKREVSLTPKCTPNIEAVETAQLGLALTGIAAAVQVVGGDTDVTKCTLSGSNMTRATVGKRASVLIKTFDFQGNERSGSGDAVEAALVPMRKGGAVAGSGRKAVQCAVGDNGDGTYPCSYTPTVAEGEWGFVVKVNGEHIAGSPFAVTVSKANRKTAWQFTSAPPYGGLVVTTVVLSEDGRRATGMASGGIAGVIADGPGCEPMTEGRHYWEIERVVHGEGIGEVLFGVCRPGTPIDRVHGGQPFHELDGTWLLFHEDDTHWDLDSCSSCKGTGCTDKRQMGVGERIGLLLDLDNGGTLTIYRNNAPCGTIAVGLVGPLLPCASTYRRGTSVRIHGWLEPPEW
jgi:hypothetical protein